MKITKKELHLMDKKTTRDMLIGEGIYNIHKSKVFKSDKEYTRKIKHKKALFEG